MNNTQLRIIKSLGLKSEEVRILKKTYEYIIIEEIKTEKIQEFRY